MESSKDLKVSRDRAVGTSGGGIKPAGRQNTMNAIVHDKYGAPDEILNLREIDKPVV